MQPTGWPLEAATQAQPPDGFTLLVLSESPYLHGVLIYIGAPVKPFLQEHIRMKLTPETNHEAAFLKLGKLAGIWFPLITR